MLHRSCLRILLYSLLVVPARADLLTNGNFEAAPILGAGQTDVPIGAVKAIQKDSSQLGYGNAISGIQGWTYATPYDHGMSSDHGLARRNAGFGLPSDGQSAYVNNWNRMVSQSVAATLAAGDTAFASIDFGTLGADGPPDVGRAGIFYLVAGEADAADPDHFSARSVILGQLTVANPNWTQSTPDLLIGNNEYVRLNLSYTFQTGDAALGLPLTIAFRTVWGSYGPTYWDNAALSVQRAVPEPASAVTLGLGTLALLGFAWSRRA